MEIKLDGGLLAIPVENAKWAIVSDIEYRQPAARPTRLATFVCSSKAGATTVRSYATKTAKAKGLL